jgi:D-sedoheptulose 7-phosphate isomerase
MEDLIKIEDIILSSANLKKQIADDLDFKKLLLKVAKLAVETFKKDGKVFFCGNGGSAADAQHLAAEFSGRFYTDRDPLFSEALHVNSSYVSAVANDYSWDEVYSRLVKAKCRKGDILFAISTSGNSANVVNAVIQAKKQDTITIGFTGESGGKLKSICDYNFCIPSSDTPRIQECHILIGHVICQLVEEIYFEQEKA